MPSDKGNMLRFTSAFLVTIAFAMVPLTIGVHMSSFGEKTTFRIPEPIYEVIENVSCGDDYCIVNGYRLVSNETAI